MSIAELDKLAADGRMSSVTLIRCGDRWQVVMKLGRTKGYAAHTAATPSEALAATLRILPVCEDYDLKNGFGDTSATPPKVEPAAAPAVPATPATEGGLFD